ENQQSVAVLGKAELARAAKHSLRFDAAQLARFDLEIADEHRAGQRERNFVTYFVIRRAADDLPRLAAAVIDLANGEAIRVRMLLRSLDLRDHDLVEIRAALLDAFDLDSRHRKRVRELIDVRRQLHEFPQPVNRKFHVWGAHAPSRAPFGASPNGREYEKRFSAGAPKTAREARALPR